MEAYNDECKKHYLLINGKRVISFFKVMIAETFVEVLGWDKYSSEHDLKVGEFFLFHYVPNDRHFIVQIFGTSGCEKINFGSNIGKGKQNERTYQETTTPLLDPKEAS
ncbi:hypothetical protein H5410_052383 [Solanum commersonii]|uniref:B3 domain-containing protein n=1 Tax=Solanum commersonii TaxID=4109 RepID=A0A9J5X391_SOLCO|nr:hypothetical protein H5410_052383 [Solanum commersonii]